ncbi:NAD(P)H-dependent oxidoreductase [uncultured Desulfosarcina sp.]|uniref:NAD(P)H-dependent oxidoreductase n=1 Tax=uncultured Desulfosarcina sp. TaxID=218289 RepID=UPI0029C92879|nr:NAD(P)H-dependent oxidoreductase [uncultured Desulfosarcina sp.]
MLILGLQGSPRKGGNTDTFLVTFLEKAAQAGAAVKTIQVARAGIIPCKGCGYCETHGTCVIADDPMSTEIFGLLREADLVVAATPVFFYGISAQLKVLIDRCQTLWSRKYVYKLKDPLAATRKGLLFSVAASRGRQLFDGIHLTAKYFFDAIDAQFSHALTYRGVEARGAIRQHEGLAADIDETLQKTVLPLVNRKKVLFLSPTGACRAPMAAAMAQQRYGEKIRTGFGGWSPGGALHEPMIRTMQRAGVDMGYRKPLNVEQALYGATPDLTITIGNSAKRMPVPGKNRVHWSLPEPVSPDDAAMDRLRLETEAHVDTLRRLIK